VPGDGVRGFIVSSRSGELATATVHNGKAELAVASLEAMRGDTIDFVVDFNAGLNSDMFLWAPIITKAGARDSSADQSTAEKWNANKEFAGPLPPQTVPLTPWEQYAQVLLLSNEFVFVE
jgi:hypothetical protein